LMITSLSQCCLVHSFYYRVNVHFFFILNFYSGFHFVNNNDARLLQSACCCQALKGI
jgi:hypothetical protein